MASGSQRSAACIANMLVVGRYCAGAADMTPPAWRPLAAGNLFDETHCKRTLQRDYLTGVDDRPGNRAVSDIAVADHDYSLPVHWMLHERDPDGLSTRLHD